MRVYSFLCIGDLHIKLSSIEIVRKVKSEILKIIEKIKPDYIVLLGDMHDTFEKVHLQSWNEIVFFIKDLLGKSKRLFYIVGNHDMLNNQVFLSNDHFFNVFKNIDGISIVDKPESLFLDDGAFSVGFIPYIPTGRLKEISLYKHKVVFGHQEIKNANFGHAISENGDDWDKNGPLLISGHIHEYQRLPNVIYVGTPYQTNFAESPDKSISLIHISKSEVTEKRIFLNLPQKILLETNPEGFMNYEFNDNNEYKVIITASTLELATLKKSKKYKKLNKNIKILLKPTDKSFVKKNAANLNFFDLLQKEVAKESQIVQEIFKEVVSEVAANKL